MPTTAITPINTGTVINGTTATQIIPPNNTRGGLLIHNPHATITMWIAPLGTTPAPNGAGSYAIFAGADRLFINDTRATCGWSAILGTVGSGNASVLEFSA
jgi:hypothetical protein